jgi:prepilin-type N-terminal cleavage/methylation domain-containing protein
MKRGERGFSLVEVLLALLLLALGMLAVVPMFVYGARRVAASADIGKAGAAAVKRMERLRATEFGALAAGGSLNSNVVSYSDATDSAVIVRWSISDDVTPATVKTISVVAIARRQVSGPAKRVQLVTMRAR